MFLGPGVGLPSAQAFSPFPLIELIPQVVDLSWPVAVTHAGDGCGRQFITLQGGQILIFDGTKMLSTPFLDISPLVSCCDEQGLLSVAFHPNYAVNGRLFVNYTNTSGDTVVERYTVSVGKPNVVDPQSGVAMLLIDQPFSNHNGGQLHFGPEDGHLYIGMGDGGDGGDPEGHAQNPLDLLRKMLRIDVDGGVPYAIPSDKPFVSDPNVQSEIWALGLRNPWRFSFDRQTGDLFIGDVGQSRFEEINWQLASSQGGENYGWNQMEGLSCFSPSTNCMDVSHGTLTLPILDCPRSEGRSVTGGYRYRGAQLPHIEGMYFYGDFIFGGMWGIRQDSQGNWGLPESLAQGIAVSAFGEDEAGELDALHYAATGGTLYRIGSGVTFDINADGCETSAIDGLLFIRHLFGLRGDAPAEGLVDFSQLCPTMPEHCPGILETRLEQARQAYGDGNGAFSPMQDGQVVYRFLSGLRGQDLIQCVVDLTAPRNTPGLVENFLRSFEFPAVMLEAQDVNARSSLSGVSATSEAPSVDQARDSLANDGGAQKRKTHCRKTRKSNVSIQRKSVLHKGRYSFLGGLQSSPPFSSTLKICNSNFRTWCSLITKRNLEAPLFGLGTLF